MSENRIPFEAAMVIARELYEQLAPVATRVKAVGSLRRRRPTVKDLEFLIEPRPTSSGLFGEEKADVEAIRAVARGWGRFVRNGDRAMQVEMANGLNIDLFLVHPPAQWGSLLAIRTGPAELGKWAVMKMADRGLKHRDGHVERADGSLFPTPTEEDFFAAASLPCLPPSQRDSPLAMKSVPLRCLDCGELLDAGAVMHGRGESCSGCLLRDGRKVRYA